MKNISLIFLLNIFCSQAYSFDGCYKANTDYEGNQNTWTICKLSNNSLSLEIFFSNNLADSDPTTCMVREAVGMALDEAVIGSFEEYAVKMEELASRKSILLEVAKGMVRDMGVKIETADSDANVDVKKSFETAMSLPGLASVTMAIINESAKTRKMLRMIHTELATQTSVMNGSTPPAVAGGKGAPVV